MREDTQDKLNISFEDIGEQQLKNIARPVRVYRVRLDDTPARRALALPDRPSIAVLAFENMSGDPEQEYFADGISDDIITELSRFSDLFVIARNSSFRYKGKAVDLRQVGRELGVRYALEGSVRRGGDRVRINAQLTDAGTGIHRWAERYDQELKDVFAIQDNVARTIAAILVAHVNVAEAERTFASEDLAKALHFYLQDTPALPDVERLSRNRLAQNALMQRFCEEAGIPFLDLTTALQERVENGENMYFPDDSHLNEAGEALTAAMLAEFLREQGLIKTSR